jgi:hypothetical protein
MVRTTNEQFTAPPNTAAIVGGFVSLPVRHLLAVWFACQGLDLGIGHFRAWIACHEMVKRRSFAPQGSPLSYGFPELATLLGVTLERARILIHDLVNAGLLMASESAITFPEPTPLPDDLFGPFANTIGRGRGRLMIPRRLLRFLARGASSATIAVALAALFRCLSCRQGHPDGWGRFKASWIARAFRVSERQVKDARHQLVDLGWLIVDADNRQHAMNRWGRAYRIDLAWNPPAPTLARSAPPPPANIAHSAPPLLDRNPLREAIQNQNPASGGPTGVSLSEGGGGTKPPLVPLPPVLAPPAIRPAPMAPEVPPATVPAPLARPPVPSPVLSMTRPGPAPASPGVVPPARPSATSRPSPAARLEDVRLEDLKDTPRLMNLLGQAVARDLVSHSEADRLRFVGAAEHALALGKENPAGLFVSLVHGKLWRYLTQEDEDRANRRIKAFLRGPEPARVGALVPGRAMGGSRSLDAQVVSEVRAAFIREGVFRDPFPEFARRNPSWSRERWDAAMAELQGAR